MNEKLALLKKYQSFTIYRWSIIVFLASPIPVATTKLNGFHLSEWEITLVILIGNLLWMGSERVNALNLRVIYMAAVILDFAFMLILLAAYLNNVELTVILITFPALTGLVAVLTSVCHSKINNSLKDVYKEDFAMDKFNARSMKYLSGAGLTGQLVVMGVYSTGVDPDPLAVLVWVEVVSSVFLLAAEFVKWRLLRELKVL